MRHSLLPLATIAGSRPFLSVAAHLELDVVVGALVELATSIVRESLELVVSLRLEASLTLLWACLQVGKLW